MLVNQSRNANNVNAQFASAHEIWQAWNWKSLPKNDRTSLSIPYHQFQLVIEIFKYSDREKGETHWKGRTSYSLSLISFKIKIKTKGQWFIYHEPLFDWLGEIWFLSKDNDFQLLFPFCFRSGRLSFFVCSFLVLNFDYCLFRWFWQHLFGWVSTLFMTYYFRMKATFYHNYINKTRSRRWWLNLLSIFLD